MKTTKLFCFSLFLVATMLLSSVMVSASTPLMIDHSLYSIAGTVETISIDQLPEGVIPIAVDGQEELYQIIQQIESEALSNQNKVGIVEIIGTALTRSSGVDHHTRITSASAGLGNVWLNCYVHYNNGRITSLNPYTSFEGFTYGFTWNESARGGSIASDGKTGTIYASGEVGYYFLVNVGFLEFYRKPVSLTAYVWMN